mmetsp:Transcript_81385/g.144132  ORF Transcript_81385/g.144132 Transcript_81385/m.144132 type:complete len:119 (+) Transcript_81385:348-704(+)
MANVSVTLETERATELRQARMRWRKGAIGHAKPRLGLLKKQHSVECGAGGLLNALASQGLTVAHLRAARFQDTPAKPKLVFQIFVLLLHTGTRTPQASSLRLCALRQVGAFHQCEFQK